MPLYFKVFLSTACPVGVDCGTGFCGTEGFIIQVFPWHSATGHLSDHVFPLVEISDRGFNPTRPLFRSSKLTICFFVRLKVNTVLFGFDSSRRTLPPCSSAI